MNFNSEHKVIIDSMDKTEASAFLKFLESEIIRHQDDIAQAENLVNHVRLSPITLGMSVAGFTQRY